VRVAAVVARERGRDDAAVVARERGRDALAVDARARGRDALAVDVRFLAGRAAPGAEVPGPCTSAATLPIWASKRRSLSSSPTATRASALSLRMSFVMRLRSFRFCFLSLLTALSTEPPALLCALAIAHLHPLMSCRGSMIAQRSPLDCRERRRAAPGACQAAAVALTLVRRVVNSDPSRIRAKPTIAPIVSGSWSRTTPSDRATAGLM
jgi:hypothetical protein